MTKDELRNKFKEGVVAITFEKADGTLRTMNATLNEDIIPKSDLTGTAKSSDETQTVWDFDNSVWRSFRWDRLKSD